jgi:hypothetical protein
LIKPNSSSIVEYLTDRTTFWISAAVASATFRDPTICLTRRVS